MADRKSTSQQTESTSPINTYDREGGVEGGTLNAARAGDNPVAVYDRPETAGRAKPNVWIIIMVLALLSLVSYFLVQFVF